MLAAPAFTGFIPVRSPARTRGFYAGTLGLRVAEDTAFAVVTLQRWLGSSIRMLSLKASDVAAGQLI